MSVQCVNLLQATGEEAKGSLWDQFLPFWPIYIYNFFAAYK